MNDMKPVQRIKAVLYVADEHDVPHDRIVEMLKGSAARRAAEDGYVLDGPAVRVAEAEGDEVVPGPPDSTMWVGEWRAVPDLQERREVMGL